MPEYERRLVWRSLDEPGLEYFTLNRKGTGWRLKGDIARRFVGTPIQASYEVICDNDWETRKVVVYSKIGRFEHKRELRIDGTQQWWSKGRKLGQFLGCYDVDLQLTPSTNTLPIRRLSLRVGESRDIDAIWIRFPKLNLQLLPQRYTRLGQRLYRYGNRTSKFSVDLEVDEFGWVTSYPGYWELEGTAK